MRQMLTPIEFDGKTVRMRGTQDSPLFVGQDVCAILEIAKPGNAMSRLDDDERVPVLEDTLGGQQTMTAITESGLYALIMTSRKPEAKRFRKWITSEVIPSIRRTGSYRIDWRDAPSPTLATDISVNANSIAIAAKRFEITLAYLEEALRKHADGPAAAFTARFNDRLECEVARLDDEVRHLHKEHDRTLKELHEAHDGLAATQRELKHAWTAVRTERREKIKATDSERTLNHQLVKVALELADERLTSSELRQQLMERGGGTPPNKMN